MHRPGIESCTIGGCSDSGGDLLAALALQEFSQTVCGTRHMHCTLPQALANQSMLLLRPAVTGCCGRGHGSGVEAGAAWEAG